jgi:hypothetical protein
MRKVLAVAAALALGAGTYADISTFYTLCQPPDVDDPLVPDFNDGSYWAVDLMVHVYNDDDWTSTYATATLDKGVFFEHPLGDDTPPPAAWVNLNPALEYDSFYAAPDADLGNQPPYKDPHFVDPVVNKPQCREALWFDVPPNGGDGDFLVARYTMQVPAEQLPAMLHLWGSHATSENQGYLTPYNLWVVIPEPGSLALLGFLLLGRTALGRKGG